MSTKQELSGKGLSRVQIAEGVVGKLEYKLEAAKARLVKAQEDEKAGAAKAEAKKAGIKNRAIAALVKAGKTEKEAAAFVG